MHWNMSCWLELGCSRVLLGLRLRWVERDVSGGCMLGFVRGEVTWVVSGGSLGGLVVFCRRFFFMGWVFDSWEWAGLGSEYGWVFVIFCGEGVLG